MKHACLPLLALLCIVFGAGCGGDGRMNIRGRIVKGGSAFTVPEDDFVRLAFVPVMPDGKPPTTSYIAAYNNKEGTFKVLGADLAGLPSGKYRVTVSHERKRGQDLFKGAYDLEKSPFVFDITSSSQEIVIDLDKTKL
jgi:hypothetical protein